MLLEKGKQILLKVIVIIIVVVMMIMIMMMIIIMIMLIIIIIIIIIMIIIKIVIQDNMIDEEKAKREEAAQLSMEEKIALLDQQVDALSTRWGRIWPMDIKTDNSFILGFQKNQELMRDEEGEVELESQKRM